MAKPTGFLEYKRKQAPKREVAERKQDYKEVEKLLSEDELEIQAARCMDCGIPTCHAYGCPLGNYIPDWNEMVYKKKWHKALELLQATNNFPEITGKICPALCEASCTLYLNKSPVAIRQLELAIVEKGWEEGWITPQLATQQTGKQVAIVGSGQAGLAAAQQLARQGHKVTIFEKSDRIGGLLRYGIPDFKLDKKVIDRRLEQMLAEGVKFQTNVNVGEDVKLKELQRDFQAVLITAGAGLPRDLKIPGRELKGIHFALEFLKQQNQINAGDCISETVKISAKNKEVVVIGGGDTGSDCIGTSIRQGAKKVTQIELLPQPPEIDNPLTPWPQWPHIMRTSTSQAEGCKRMWSIATKEILGKTDKVIGLKAIKLAWEKPQPGVRPSFKEISDSEFEIKADLVLLAMGFVHIKHDNLVEELSLDKDQRGNIKVNEDLMTSVPGVFAAGDAEVGASLVVRAINRGRQAAEKIDHYLSELR